MRRNLANPGAASDIIDEIPDESTIPIAAGLERAELKTALATLRSELAPADRLLLKLRFDDGLPVPEIASMLRYPSQFHVYRRINALLNEMKSRLEARGFENVAL
jgi:DNA-directed RNA polymerase specialized sigma subunit